MTIVSLNKLQTAAIAFTLAALVHVVPAQANPFSTLQGSWGGSGRVQFESGQSEALRCTAHYTASGGGNQLGLAIRCASASNRIELRGRLVNSGGRVSGTWEERTYNVSGTANGRANDSNIVLRLAGAIPGSMSVSVARTRQTISISTSSNVRSVRIGLSRR
ncbi:hypothetical protein ACO2I3_12955 [Leptospira interrogans]